ncbi:MAG: response regulator [Dehalococcoidia bacterium]
MVKHAHTWRRPCSSTARSHVALVMVQDNGRGFDVAEASASKERGLGLFGMQERAGLVGGSARRAIDPRRRHDRSGDDPPPRGRRPWRKRRLDMKPIRILLVDDHAMLRAGLRALLSAEPDLDVVGEASNGEEAVALAADLKPDVVVMDIAMPVRTGWRPRAASRAARPETRVLALTMHAEEQYLLEVLQSGRLWVRLQALGRHGADGGDSREPGRGVPVPQRR